MEKKENSFFPASEARWKRFSNEKFSAFKSMHKSISIGVLSIATLTSADLKAQTQADSANAELNYQLQDIEVTTERVPLTMAVAPRLVTVMTKEDVSAASVQSINDLLEYAVGVDVRQRGEMGVQSDISVRGGTFDQITVLLNGINISSPHTGHLSADFPVSMDEIERIEVLEGPAARVFGTSAFNGAINIVTKCDNSSHVAGHVFGGSYGYAGGEMSANLSTGKVHQQISGGFRRADGDQENSDFKQTKFFYQGNLSNPALKVDWQTGVSSQDYGANTFYSAAYPNQWESTTKWITSVKAETNSRVHFVPSIYWNRSKDHFQLVRDTHKGENFHQCDVYGVNLGAWVESKIGKTAFGAEMRSENILSTNLGKPTTDSVAVRGEDSIYYKKQDGRDNISYYIEHTILLKKWTLSLGAMAHKVTNLNTKMKVYPGVDLAFRPNDYWKISASWNMAMRLPTFTDLYYKSPTNEGNVGLKPEESSAIDLGVRYRNRGIESNVSLFYHHGTNMIDWVMYSADDIFHSAAFELKNKGFELNAAFLGREVFGEKCPVRKVSFGYAHINQEREDEVEIYKSNYALEYLRHKLSASLETRVVKNLNATLSLRYQNRNGSYIKYDENHKSTGELVDYDPYTLVDLKLSWDAANWSVYAIANNLFNVSYYDLGNIPQPGVWLKAGAKFKIGIK
ncbi:MAG: TonB-dependent receptor [Paludibacteraceae bacterium]|nr:TonB-dependent receptor [Paludibacteraceae bacterium]